MTMLESPGIGKNIPKLVERDVFVGDALECDAYIRFAGYDPKPVAASQVNMLFRRESDGSQVDFRSEGNGIYRIVQSIPEDEE